VNRRIPPLGATMMAIISAIAVALFVYLSGRFGGPTIQFSKPYLVSAQLPDSKELAVRSDVLDRGVRVGQVEAISLRGNRALVTFSIDRRYAPLHRGASIQVAEKTLLGESFIALDPGPRAAPALRSGTMLSPSQVLPASVEIDQALNALDPRAIAHLKGILAATATGVGAPGASQQVAATLAALPALTSHLRQLAAILAGQEAQIASGVIDTHTVLNELGERQQQLAAIVSGARATLAALDYRTRALGSGLGQLPVLLSTARRTLHDARPLLLSARPLLSDLRMAAPPLARALEALPPVTGGANTLLDRLPSFDDSVVPFLAALRPVLALLDPTGVALGPALRNLVTIAAYLSARKNTFTAWFANTEGLGQQGDAKGKFARFFIFMEPGTSSGIKGGDYQSNPYTAPNDALHNEPYSGYPRLEPYNPGAPHR
jgi:phospholipid/cholesterol/gamma-HCH transport system substrate-binding protein